MSFFFFDSLFVVVVVGGGGKMSDVCLVQKRGKKRTRAAPPPPVLFLLPDFRRRLGLDFALDELAALGLGAELERAGEAAELLGAEGPKKKKKKKKRGELRSKKGERSIKEQDGARSMFDFSLLPTSFPLRRSLPAHLYRA